VSQRSFVSASTRDRVRGWAVPVALAFGRMGLTPNALTIIGFMGTVAAAWAAASQSWTLAGILVIVFGIFDLFDGTLARATGRASKFGAFLDSTLDRTGESLVLAGVAVGSAAAGFMPGVVLASLAATAASGVTYARAKAESLGLRGDVGFAPREVRLVLLSVGLVALGILGGFSKPPLTTDWGDQILVVTLGLITLLSAITIVQRIFHVRQQLDQQESK